MNPRLRRPPVLTLLRLSAAAPRPRALNSMRRLTAAGLLLLLAALWLAPVGAVCGHASDRAEIAAEHQHDGAPAHAGHTVAATSPDAEAPASSCPMEQGQAECSAPAPLPNGTIVYHSAPTAEWGPFLAPALEPPDTERPPIFRPPKA